MYICFFGINTQFMGNFHIPIHFFLLFGFFISCQSTMDHSTITGQVSEDSLRMYTKVLSSDEYQDSMNF